MSTVYLAERDDGHFEQTVAIKVLRPGFGADNIVRRFRAERQILAALHHPHIARLYSGGMTSSESEKLGDRLPYLVMEYVAGQPVDRYCDAKRLSIRERSQLFTVIAETVQYAHSNLVVHRDLKPSNILVSDDGQVKLLDFGIAKVLAPDEATGGVHATQAGHRWMTVEYAAPEQIRDEPVTTATDIYQLGVVLYELLTGHRPYRLDRPSTYDVERAICELEPRPPSVAVRETEDIRTSDGESVRTSRASICRMRRTSVSRLTQRLRGDLDVIVLKALRKEPPERYASAQAMAEDIRRYLSGRPISAYGGTLAYQTRKFVHRNRAAVTSAALLFTFVVGLSAFYANRIVESSDRAYVEARKAERTVEFLVSLFDQAHPANWKLNQNIDAAVLVLETATTRVDELESEPDAQAELLHTLGEIYTGLGRSDRAATLLRRALALRRELHGNRGEDVAATLYAYGSLLAHSRTDSAVVYFRDSARLRREAFRGDHDDLAWSLLQWSRYLPFDDAEKEPLRVEAMDMFRRLHGPRSAEVAMALHEYYVLGFGTQDSDVFDEAFREVLSIELEQLGEENTRTAATIHNYGLVLDSRGQHEEGLAHLVKSHEINRRVLGARHPQVSLMAINVAATLHEQNRFAEAEAIFREALDARRATLPDSSSGLAYSMMWLSRNLMAQDRFDEAEPLLREARSIQVRIDSDRAACNYAQRYLGRCLLAQRKYQEAADLLLDSYSRCDTVWNPMDAARIETLENLIAVHEARERPEEATLYRAALTEVSRNLPGVDPESNP
jgi:serine/threonine-protein kinase